MSAMLSPEEGAWTPALLAELSELAPADAARRLAGLGLWRAPSAAALAEAALEQGEAAPSAAARWLALAAAIGEAIPLDPVVAGQIAYAGARLRVQAGELAEAEAALRASQAFWQRAGARAWLARSDLGLTQVLAMQGRYAEAETAVRRAIAALTEAAAADASVLLQVARAHRNLATLQVYQEQHSTALDAYAAAEAALAALQGTPDADGQGAALQAELAHVALNRASALTFLDRPDEAEAALLAAMAGFERAGEPVNRARGQANLGRLYLRIGRYAAALDAFDEAAAVLIGDLPADESAALDALRQADELLLEHALAYVALNLVGEAQLALDRAEALFRRAAQPYELAQSLYTRGLLALNLHERAAAAAALNEAAALYTELNNPYWLRRVRLALAALAEQSGDAAGARAQVAALLGERSGSPALGWDLGVQVEVWLFALRLALAQHDLAGSRAAAGEVERLLSAPLTPGTTDATPLPHWALRLLHARGQIEQAEGDPAGARRYFGAALALLEQQRATLPLEEMRSAFLEDKTALYSDLVLSLLDTPLPSDDDVAAAFAVVERARSRALLERLMASVDTQPLDADPLTAARREALRRQLHWLYNQLLGESDSRRASGEISRQMQIAEAAMQQLEWRAAPLLEQVEPVQLAELQAALAADQQALVYYFAGDEVMVFVVGAQRATVVRRLATVDEVALAQAELRFQLGRAELGPDYLARRGAHLLRQLTQALARLHDLLIAPVREQLTAARWLIVPFGGLHLLPFHALWHNGHYLIEAAEFAYAPSASVAVRVATAGRAATIARFAGIAPHDPTIPYAQSEVTACAQLFDQAALYVADAAGRARLVQAAAEADVLHLATHGLFRPDNSFFSALKLADGWMDVREIYRLPLRARLVVLSACESGAGQVRGGDEVIGLARGFLAAGAASVVASLWNVHDRSTAALMIDFYQALLALDPCDAETGTRPAAALAAAQRRALAAGQHPYYWAPFIVIG